MTPPDLSPCPEPAGALRRAAVAAALDVTVVTEGEVTTVAAVSPPPVPSRRPLSVYPRRPGGRDLLVSGWSRGIELVKGETSDPGEVVRAAVAWGEGRSLGDLHALFPFLSSDERAQAHENGPDAVVALQWRRLREEAADTPGFSEFGLLVEAARADPVLGRLSVFSSHWVLGVSAATSPRAAVEVVLVPGRDGRPYRVREYLHPDPETGEERLIGEAGTAGEAVALAVAHLPAGIGPAVAGPGEPPGR
ncbi:DUF6193 family natural product biosynthesis protein [Streptomyces laurentii]|uniref:DUF6193 family natural product biosynthesis protein n=1 Tax=Streptomyces laurentii TaxID=39478 RepID=UPI003683A51F